MNQISQEIIDRILDEVDILSEISEDITLHKKGVNYIGLCPFHSEKTPSFTVSPSKGICKCFSCGKGGNVIWYRMQHDGLSYPEAIRELGRKHNIDIPIIELSPEQQQRQDERASAMIAITEAYNLFRNNLNATPEAQAYLAERKISKEIIDLYGVGFAFDYDGLSRTMLSKGYQQEHLLRAGVSYFHDEKKRLKDVFWQRVLFPYFNKTGQVVGFTGRAINDQSAKYKNTAETILFTKGKNIYGLYQARTAIQKEDKVYIVEGQFDVLSMFQAGIQNVIGGSGTAFTPEQRKLLHGITSNIVFIYDGDAAGIAAEKNLQAFVSDAFKVRCVALPNGKDPDDMVKVKGDEFGQWLNKVEMSYVDFMSKTLFLKDDDEYQRLDKTKQILSIILKEKETIIRDSFLGTLAVNSGYDLDRVFELIDDTNIPEAPERFEAGFIGAEFAKDFIDPEEKEVHLVNDFSRFQTLIGDKEPYLFYSGVPSINDIQELSQLAERVVVHSPDMDCNYRKENSDCLMMKELFKYGMTVDVATDTKIKGFIYYYVEYYGALIVEESPTPEVQNEYITRCAEMISYAKQAIQTVNLPNWSELLGLKLSSMKELIKPFTNERKSKQKIDRERSDVYNDLMSVDTDRLPDYVEESEEYSRMLRRYGFYPLLNKDGVPVSYMFKVDHNSYRRVADFYIDPLFHVYSKNKEENRRVIRINRLYVNKPTYVDCHLLYLSN